MHRQSLGSPPSKHHHVAVANEEETLTADESPKPRRFSSPPPTPTPHKFIHFIPILTLLCFIVLYLFSHTPSPSDLNQFTGFSHHLDSAAEMNDIKRSDVLAIRSLQQIPKSGLHRKLVDF